MSEAARKHAIILSGGGGYGAYEVGVLKALLTGKSPTTGFEPLVPDIMTGTSVGAYNATYLVSRLGAGPEPAVHDLEQVWMERVAGGPGTCGNGVFRIRLNPAEYAQPTCYIPDPLRPLRTTVQDAVYFATQFMARTVSAVRSRGPFLERLVEEIDLSAAIDAQPYDDSIRDTIDFDAVRRSPIRLSIFATVWETGAARRFDNAAGTVTAQAVQASASLPGVFPPTIIDGKPYVDGGLSINSPLMPAIAAGAEVIHVVFLDPKMRDIPMRVPLSTVTELYRMIAILFANETRAQIVQIDQLNRALRLLENPPRELQDEDLTAFLLTLDQLRDHVERTKLYRPIEIHAYRPSPEVLEGLAGFLNFERPYVRKLIDAGYEDAVRRAPRPATSATTPLESSFLRA
jgi:NTE family protein